MTQPGNNPASSLASCIPLAEEASTLREATDDSTAPRPSDPRTRNWLFVAGILWIIQAIVPLWYLLVVMPGGKDLLPTGVSERTLIIASQTLTILLGSGAFCWFLWLAAGSFLQRRWMMKPAAVTSLLLLMIAGVYNPMFAYFDQYVIRLASLGRPGIATDSRIGIISLSILAFSLAGLLCFIHLRTATRQLLAPHHPNPRRQKEIPISRLLQVAWALLATLGVIIVMAGLSSVSPFFPAQDSQTILPWLMLVLGLAVVIMTPRNSRWTWCIALPLYGAWAYCLMFRQDMKTNWEYSYVPGLIILCIGLGLMHLWFPGRSRKTASDPASNPSPQPGLPATGSPYSPLAGTTGLTPAHVTPDRTEKIQLASVIPISAGASPIPPVEIVTCAGDASAARHSVQAIHQLGYASLTLDESHRMQKQIILCAILWIYLAMDEAIGIYSNIQYQLMMFRNRGYYFRYTDTDPAFFTRTAYLMALMAAFAWIGVGLLQKKRWAGPVAAAVAIAQFCIGIISSGFSMAHLYQYHLMYPTSSLIPARAGMNLLSLVVLGFLVYLHSRPGISMELQRLNPQPSRLDRIPIPSAHLVIWFVLLGLFSLQSVFFPLSEKLKITGGIWPSAIVIQAIFSSLTAVLIYKKSTLGSLPGFIVCGIGLWRGAAMARLSFTDAGKPLAEATLCLVITIFLFRYISKMARQRSMDRKTSMTRLDSMNI